MIYKGIIMKKILPILALAMGAVFPAGAEESEQTHVGPKQGWYVGLEALKTEVTSNAVNSKSVDLDTGAAFTLGFDKKFTNNFVMGIEFEYANYGSNKVGEAYANSSNGPVLADVEDSFSGYGLNIRPKYYFSNTKFYLGALLGYSATKYEMELTKTNYNSANVESESGNGFTYGIEAGYEFDSGWMIQGGYRGLGTEFYDINVDLTALYIGGRYKF
ncbi:porin family protein [Vibrio navarrensis]|nr:porin family protein [Vibrio navarrensis]